MTEPRTADTSGTGAPPPDEHWRERADAVERELRDGTLPLNDAEGRLRALLDDQTLPPEASL